MPANTPIYGFTYPCNTDTVTFADFALLANQIEARLTSIRADANYATGRYVHLLNAGPQAAIAPSVETPLTNVGTVYNVPAEGIYHVSYIGDISGTTTLDSYRIRIRRTATPLFGLSANNNGGSTAFHPQIDVSGLLYANVGDTINSTVIWFGTGTATVTLSVHIRQVVRIQ